MSELRFMIRSLTYEEFRPRVGSGVGLADGQLLSNILVDDARVVFAFGI